MSKAPEKLNELNQKAVEATAKMAQLSAEQGERLLKLQFDAMRHMLDDGLKGAKSLLEVRDPQQWGAVQQRNMQEMMKRFTDYSRSVQEVAGKTQKEIAELLEARTGAMNAQLQAMVDEMAKAAPPGSESAFAAMKQSLAAANALADNMKKTAEQFAKSAETAIKATTDAATKAGKGDA